MHAALIASHHTGRKLFLQSFFKPCDALKRKVSVRCWNAFLTSLTPADLRFQPKRLRALGRQLYPARV